MRSAAQCPHLTSYATSVRSSSGIDYNKSGQSIHVYRIHSAVHNFEALLFPRGIPNQDEHNSNVSSACSMGNSEGRSRGREISDAEWFQLQYEKAQRTQEQRMTRAQRHNKCCRMCPRAAVDVRRIGRENKEHVYMYGAADV